MSDWQSFLRHEDTDDHRVDFKCVYVDMAGDLIAGLLLSQIVYWNLPSKNGSSKLRVQRQGHWWLAKKYKDWYDECRISERQARQAVTLLEEKGLITTAVFRFAGSPTVHIRVNPEQFLAAWEDAAEKQAEADRARDAAKSRQMDMTPTSNPNDVQGDSSTETTAETTTVSSAVAEADSTPAVPVVSDPPAKRKRATKKPPTVTPQEDAGAAAYQPQEWVGALAVLCRLEWRIKSIAGRLAKRGKELHDAGYTVAQIEAAFGQDGWWYRNDWRGKQGQYPTPEQIQELVSQAVVVAPVAVASSGGKPWYADGGSMGLPVQTSHGRGNDG